VGGTINFTGGGEDAETSAGASVMNASTKGTTRQEGDLMTGSFVRLRWDGASSEGSAVTILLSRPCEVKAE